jgi:fused signal recognition particle receptor
VKPDAPRRRRLRGRIGRSRAPFRGLRNKLRARAIDDEVWEELEETLLAADVGLPTTADLVDRVRASAARDGVRDADAVPGVLEAEIVAMLGEDRERGLAFVDAPTVWLLVGVNGVGKTTTAAKLAASQGAAGRQVVLAAADTFRAAAADQLAHWADQTGAELVRGQEGGDPGSVAFDAVERARARDADLVIVDTAGRLHTKANLMEELKKIRRVVERGGGTVAEVLLVLDAATGQNGLVQAREFTDAVGVTGVVLTKLDGTPKGGIVLAIEEELDVPVKLVGIGEAADDLVVFDPAEFAAALVGADGPDDDGLEDDGLEDDDVEEAV